MPTGKPLNPGPNKGPDPMETATAMVAHLFEQVNQQIAANTRSIGELGAKIDKLTEAISNQAHSIDRLDRGIQTLTSSLNEMSAGIKEQTSAINKQAATTDSFLQTIREQNQIIQQALSLAKPALTGGKA